MKDYEEWKMKAEKIRNRNFELMKKVLNLRRKMLEYFYFAASKSRQGSQEEYNLALRDLFDQKNKTMHARTQLLKHYIINPFHKKQHDSG